MKTYKSQSKQYVFIFYLFPTTPKRTQFITNVDEGQKAKGQGFSCPISLGSILKCKVYMGYEQHYLLS